MKEYSLKKRIVLSFNLSFITGFIDVIGFLLAGTVFLSFMSGNSTILADGIAKMDLKTIVNFGLSILTFVVGCFLGDIVASKVKDKVKIILLIEIFIGMIFLAMASVTDTWYSFLLLVIMMGMQNSIHVKVAGEEAAKTFVTGTLQKLGVALSQAVQKKGGYKKAGGLFFAWFSFFVGGFVGALLVGMASINILILIAILILVLTLILDFLLK